MTVDEVDTPLPEALERLAAIPKRDRTYDCSEREATSFGLGSRALELLDEHGYTSRGGEGVRYCSNDLHFLGLRLGAEFYIRTWRAMASSFFTLTKAPSTALSVKYLGWVRKGTARGVARAPNNVETEIEIMPGQPAYELRTTVRRRPYVALPPALQHIGDELAAYELYPLPAALKYDLDFVRTTGVCDCFAAARLLLDAAGSAGFDGRFSWGLLLTLPFASPHAWAEIRIGGTWEAYDPLLLTALARFGGLDGEAWPHSMNITTMLKRFGETECLFLEERPPTANHYQTTFITSIM
jgi:hypothetical protein